MATFLRSTAFAWIIALAFAWPVLSEAKVSIVATSADLGAIATEVGGESVSVDVLAKGTQDLHSLEPKPSFMSRLMSAQLLLANGLSLESAWLPSVVRGARNPKINPGQAGYLEFGEKLEPIEVITGSVSRAQGDVHPEGNPHWSLDPVRVGKAAILLAERLSQLDSANAAKYMDRAKKLDARMNEKAKAWAERIKKTGIREVVTYHKTLNYFLERMSIKGAGYLEPKPGIPPSAQHILDLIKTVKERGVRLILVESFYDDKAAQRVASEYPEMKVKSVPVAVDSAPGLKTNDDVFEAIIKAFEGK